MFKFKIAEMVILTIILCINGTFLTVASLLVASFLRFSRAMTSRVNMHVRPSENTHRPFGRSEGILCHNTLPSTDRMLVHCTRSLYT